LKRVAPDLAIPIRPNQTPPLDTGGLFIKIG